MKIDQKKRLEQILLRKLNNHDWDYIKTCRFKKFVDAAKKKPTKENVDIVEGFYL